MSSVTCCPTEPCSVDSEVVSGTGSASILPVTASTEAAEASRSALRGLLLGLVAATCYSVTNIGLRQLADVRDGIAWDLWVCGIKALPTVVIAGVMLFRDRLAGRFQLPTLRLAVLVVATAVLMQFGGNLGFQLALRAIGLAISVPAVFASIICSGAVVGRMALGDPVGLRTGLAMGLMVVSIVFLSAGAQAGQPAAAGAVAGDVAGFSVLMGIVFALISGVSYGLGGVVIRHSVRREVPVPQVLFLFGIVGVVLLCPLGAWPMGIAGLQQISGFDWMLLLGAGTFNALGFFAITHALRLLTINKANVVNAAQNAMCAVAGIVMFAEPVTPMALLGIGLTIAGLLILGRR